jgi:hypothetical protein
MNDARVTKNQNLGETIQLDIPEIETAFAVFVPRDGGKTILQTKLPKVPVKREATYWDVLRVLEDIKTQLTTAILAEETATRIEKRSKQPNDGNV